MKPNDPKRDDRLREVLRQLPPVGADAEFKSRLARDFISGDFQSASPAWVSTSSKRSRLAWVAAVLALAVAGVFLGLRPEQPTWSVVATTGAAEIELGGRRLAPADLALRNDPLEAGLRVSVPEGSELTVASSAGVVVQLTSGTDSTLPAAGRWPWQDSWHSEIFSGELRITTAESFHGRRLWIRSDEASIEVTGTTLAVIRDPLGGSTCVCVFAGRVRMGANDAELQVVAQGLRRLMFSDGQPPYSEDILPMERMKLDMLRNQREEMLSK